MIRIELNVDEYVMIATELHCLLDRMLQELSEAIDDNDADAAAARAQHIVRTARALELLGAKLQGREPRIEQASASTEYFKQVMRRTA